MTEKDDHFQRVKDQDQSIDDAIDEKQRTVSVVKPEKEYNPRLGFIYVLLN